MKTPISWLAIVPTALAAGLAGCATPDTANTKKPSDDIARLRQEARAYEKKDGNLGAGYVVDRVFDGRDDSSKPVFDQPRGRP